MSKFESGIHVSRAAASCDLRTLPGASSRSLAGRLEHDWFVSAGRSDAASVGGSSEAILLYQVLSDGGRLILLPDQPF